LYCEKEIIRNREIRIKGTGWRDRDTYLEVIDGVSSGLSTALWSEDNLEFAWLFCDEIGAAILIAKGMTTNDNGLFPSWDETRDSGDDNWFTEDSSVEDVTNGSIG
jgi:hypothetical protein